MAMANGLTAQAVLQVARVFRDGSLVGMSDRQILERFVESQDETAFEAILTRHGPMVRRVCQQMLWNSHDVDDAVQAVFLVLVRKAGFIQLEGSLGPWLYTVARRVAARARANRRKRLERESFNDNPPEPSYSSVAGTSEIPIIIHDELGRLPERLRAPLVLCYLQGLTHDVAARQLACPVGTVRSRLARGRNLLHQRITRRGLTLTAAALGGALESIAGAAVSMHLPASLVRSITAAAVESVRINGIGLSKSFAMVLEGVLNVLPIKKVAVLATAISAGTIAFAVVGRATVGQTQELKSQDGQSLDGASKQDVTGDHLSETPKLVPKKSSSVLAIEAKLDERISVNFDKQPLVEAATSLRNYSGLNIVLDPRALIEKGVTSSTLVSLTVEQVPIRSVLKLMLRPIGLTYKVEDDGVLITSPKATVAAAQLTNSAPPDDGNMRYPKTYYVGDILFPPNRTGEKRSVTVGATAEFPKVNMTPLMDLIAVSVAPGTWNVQDGYGNQVPTKKNGRETAPQDQRNAMVPFFLSLSLIVKCPPEQHAEIAHILRCLRRLQNPGADSDERGERPFQPRSEPSDKQPAAKLATPANTVRQNKIDPPSNELYDVLDSADGYPDVTAREFNLTDVAGIPDVNVIVNEPKRVIHPQGKTTFEICLANYGTKAATNLQLTVILSPNLELLAIEGGPNGINAAINSNKDMIKFDSIPMLPPRKAMVFNIQVKATGEDPKLATCKAVIAHDGIPETFQDIAGVKVTTRLPQKVAQKRESAKTPN